jgi:hypothetical protein
MYLSFTKKKQKSAEVFTANMEHLRTPHEQQKKASEENTYQMDSISFFLISKVAYQKCKGEQP